MSPSPDMEAVECGLSLEPSRCGQRASILKAYSVPGKQGAELEEIIKPHLGNSLLTENSVNSPLLSLLNNSFTS